jgi:hypothetical protein
MQAQITTAEVTHLIESYKLEAQCYLKNHVLMLTSGDIAKDAIRQWHDNVTKPNLERIRAVAQEMGVPLPPTKLEDRENQIKEKLGAGRGVQNVFRDGEALAEVKSSGAYLNEFYTTSMNLSTTDRVRDVFRRGRESVADNLVRIEEVLRRTESYFPLPNVKQIALVSPR